MQISIFDDVNPFNITKPIRLITLFSGYDSQALSLKYLGIPFEHYHTCEWAIPSIQALKDLHFGYDNHNYSVCLSKADLVDILYAKGVSSDYNKPLTKEQLSRYPETKLRTIYNNIIATKNLVSICNINGKDLEIFDTDKYEYIMTYSFPCQDLSSAGKGAGMEKGSGTRSGLLWEVERLLEETKELPQVLLMENVPEVIGKNNVKHFAKWLEKLENLGYKNKWQRLNAIDFEIPQKRDRCFMVSILGDYYYDFPSPIGCELKLKDVVMYNPQYKLKLDKLNNVEKNVIRRIASSTTAKTVRASGRGSFDRHSWDIYGTNFGDSEAFIHDPLKETSRAIRASQAKGGYTNFEEYFYYSPLECFRLMAVKDKDFEKIAKNQSKSSLYHLAGDSIVTTVLMAIFGQMFDVDWAEKINELAEELVND